MCTHALHLHPGASRTMTQTKPLANVASSTSEWAKDDNLFLFLKDGRLRDDFWALGFPEPKDVQSVSLVENECLEVGACQSHSRRICAQCLVVPSRSTSLDILITQTNQNLESTLAPGNKYLHRFKSMHCLAHSFNAAVNTVRACSLFNMSMSQFLRLLSALEKEHDT